MPGGVVLQEAGQIAETLYQEVEVDLNHLATLLTLEPGSRRADARDLFGKTELAVGEPLGEADQR